MNWLVLEQQSRSGAELSCVEHVLGNHAHVRDNFVLRKCFASVLFSPVLFLFECFYANHVTVHGSRDKVKCNPSPF